MKVFRVWVTRLESTSRLRVDGLENAKWLLRRLSASFVFKTSEPIDEVRDSGDCTFRVAHSSQISARQLEKLLAEIREVHLLPEPARQA